MRALMLVVGLILLPGGPERDLLRLDAAPAGMGLPDGWRLREIRGAQAPRFVVLQGDSGRVLRVQGTGRAGWAFHDLDRPVPAAGASLAWSWRIMEAPARADLRRPDTDDSPFRVFVVFGPVADLGGETRAIFYSWGHAPDGRTFTSHVSDRLGVVEVGGRATLGRAWSEVRVDPQADYRRLWRGRPRPITAIGIMQDTDQTGSRAVAEIRRLSLTTTMDTGAR